MSKTQIYTELPVKQSSGFGILYLEFVIHLSSDNASHNNHSLHLIFHKSFFISEEPVKSTLLLEQPRDVNAVLSPDVQPETVADLVHTSELKVQTRSHQVLASFRLLNSNIPCRSFQSYRRS